MRGPGSIDNAICKNQSGTLLVLGRIENDPPATAAVTCAWIGRRNRCWRQAVYAGGEIERVQALEIARALFAHGDDKQSAVGSELAVDHRRGSDTNLRHYLKAAATVRRRLPAAQQRHAPKHIRA